MEYIQRMKYALIIIPLALIFAVIFPLKFIFIFEILQSCINIILNYFMFYTINLALLIRSLLGF